MSSADGGVLSAFVGKKEDVVRSGRALAVVHGREVVVIHHAGAFYAMDRLCYRRGGQAVHRVPLAQVQDHAGRGRGAVPGRGPPGPPAQGQLGIQGPEAEDPRGARGERRPVRHSVRPQPEEGVRLLPVGGIPAGDEKREEELNRDGTQAGTQECFSEERYSSRNRTPGTSCMKCLRLRSSRSVHIVALGSEGEGVEPQSGLIWTYLGRSAGVCSRRDNATHTAFPAFTEYQACVSGGVRVVIHDCPSWDLFDSNWNGSRNVVGQADIIVLKYSVNDKPAFRELKDSYTPVIKRLLSQWAVPVIVAAVGARQTDESPPCTCPLCTSDKGSCVPTCEGLELSRELGATYLELHSLSDVSAGNYFGGVLEYFIIQCLKQKSSESTKKKSPRARRPRPPLLEQPAKLAAVEVEKSSWSSDWLRLLDSGQCADVLFCAELSGRELARAHGALLCSVSPVFKQLLAPEPHDPGPAKASRSLFSERGSGRLPASVSGQDGHFQLSVRDPLLSRCLPEILRFLYTGASRWKELELSLRARLGGAPELRELLAKCSRELRALRPTRHPRSPLAALFHSPLLSDVVFKVEGAAVPAHRAVLAARCEVMAAMFSGSYVEASSRVVPVYGVSKDCFVSFLEYLYTDSCCPASVLQAMALLVCAEMYQVPRLQHLCEVCICTRLQSMSSRELASSSLGVVELLGRAQFHHAPQLSTWLLHFIASNYLIFSQKPDFSNLTRDERDFVEKHRWPSSAYLQELAEFRRHVHRRHSRCAVM
ncbi:rho-related BTB domain-containing protein 3 isoform X3 [Lepisosteus oculatus]|uniref:rho-related BTB domain-containing protein 3 isoform X3 n=1 Tax=Lepisosteus oculatus TaxID=7918 RepID=UPI00372387AD